MAITQSEIISFIMNKEIGVVAKCSCPLITGMGIFSTQREIFNKDGRLILWCKYTIAGGKSGMLGISTFLAPLSRHACCLVLGAFESKHWWDYQTGSHQCLACKSFLCQVTLPFTPRSKGSFMAASCLAFAFSYASSFFYEIRQSFCQKAGKGRLLVNRYMFCFS